MKRGFFGGAFDPIHEGHLNLAKSVFKDLGLDSLELIPNAAPPHKKASSLNFSLRVDLIKLAIKDYPFMKVNEMEKDLKHKHYTYDTLEHLRKIYGKDDPLFFLMGEDSLLALDTWHLGLKLTDFAHLAIIKRPGFNLSKASPILRDYLKDHLVTRDDPHFEEYKNKPCGKCFLLDSKLYDVSSSRLRHTLVEFYQDQNDKALSYLKEEVPDLVLKEILKHKLYQDLT